MNDRHEALAAIVAAFSQAGVDGWLHALDIDGSACIGYRSDQVCASASTLKVGILVTLMRAVAAGEVSLGEQVTIPAAGRAAGPTGLSAMTYDAQLAMRDLAQLMIAVSDNCATEILLSRVSPERVTATMRELHLMGTAMEETPSQAYQRLSAPAPGPAPELRPETTPWRTTAADMCSLLKQIWTDEAAPAALCEEMRTILRSSVLPEGLDSDFPIDVQAHTASKSGGLWYIDGEKPGTTLVVRNDVGVIQYPDGGRGP